MYLWCKRLPYIFAMFLAGICFPSMLAAHPHMSLDSRIKFEYSGETCQGFWLDWTFDPYFSAAIIQANDWNRDKQFSAEEAKAVYDTAFQNLKHYGYFVYIRTGKRRVQPEQVEHFTPEIRGDRMAYRFYVNLAGKGYGKDFSVAIFDPTYYCAVRLPKDPVVIHQLDPSGTMPLWQIGVNKQYPVYYNPLGPASDTTQYTTWKPGLETAYPEEVRVYIP